MKEPILTDQALEDLTDIWVTIARGRDEKTADRMHRKILKQCLSHAQFPESGRLRDELKPDLRSFPVHPYVVFYQPQPNTILVIRILDGRRDVKRVLSEE